MTSWDWVAIECSGGCGKVTRVPVDDQIAATGWTCVGCEYDQPNFHLIEREDTGGPEMSDAPNPRPIVGAECRCGCGNTTKKGKYSQGHDARHVSKLVAEVLAGTRSRSSALRQIESIPLKEKLRLTLDRAEAAQKAGK